MSITEKRLHPFHLAFPVNNLETSRAFYVEMLGCGEGRSSDRWIDFDFFGHQVVAHLVDHGQPSSDSDDSNPVDGREVPVPHFGVVLGWEEWQALADRLTNLNVDFVIDPYVRFEGQLGEQATMFFKDPSGNALEFKAFRNPEQMFATE